MPYNREWDQGKDAWQDSSWTAHDSRHHIRPREDDYYGDGKRRKTTHGVKPINSYSVPSSSLENFQGPQVHDTSQAYDTYATDRSNHQGGDQFQDYGQDDRHQRNKKRLVPSEPSPHVIFLGLDPDFTEADVSSYFSAPVQFSQPRLAPVISYEKWM